MVDIAKTVDVIDMPSFWKRRIEYRLLSIRQDNRCGRIQVIVQCYAAQYYGGGAQGVIDVPLSPYLIRAFGLGRHTWMAQFVFGFPIVGHMGQNRGFDPSAEEVSTPTGSPNPSDLFYTAQNRFKMRSMPTMTANAQLLRGEACV